ncbi:MAG TPA: acyl carrier protein [Actinocrinis sp.]|nr:acyl carrier protein [Actinocrinis sp.]
MLNSTPSQPADQESGDPDDLSSLVRSAWADILDFDPDDEDTGFFESGGDSHLLFVLVERLARTSGLKVKTIDVLKADTIRGQADLLRRLRQTRPEESPDES